MDFRVDLDPATAAEVRERAASLGQDPQTYVREAVREKLGQANRRTKLTVQEWREHLRKLIDIHKDAPGTFDDSRDSIYPDRAA